MTTCRHVAFLETLPVSLLDQLKAVFLDIDGTLHYGDTLWEAMHKRVGTWESHGTTYLEAFMQGTLSYEQFARNDAACWKGQSEKLLYETMEELKLFPEALHLISELRKRQIKIFLISNGIAQFAHYLVHRFGLSGYRANPLHVRNRTLTGDITIALPYKQKDIAARHILNRFDILPQQALAVGDGPGDQAMLDYVGTGIMLGSPNYPHWKAILENLNLLD